LSRRRGSELEPMISDIPFARPIEQIVGLLAKRRLNPAGFEYHMLPSGLVAFITIGTGVPGSLEEHVFSQGCAETQIANTVGHGY
jgi:hypothetical protein